MGQHFDPKGSRLGAAAQNTKGQELKAATDDAGDVLGDESRRDTKKTAGDKGPPSRTRVDCSSLPPSPPFAAHHAVQELEKYAPGSETEGEHKPVSQPEGDALTLRWLRVRKAAMLKRKRRTMMRDYH